MARRKQTDYTGPALILAGGGLLAFWWWQQQSNGGGGNGDGGNGDGGDNGGSEGLVIEALSNFEALDIQKGGTVVSVGPGGLLSINTNTQLFGVRNTVKVRNTGTQNRYLSAFMELRHLRTGFFQPDVIWLKFEPGRGLTTNYPATQGTLGAAGLAAQNLLVSPGQIRTVPLTLFIGGPGMNQAASLFWFFETEKANQQPIPLAYKLRVMDMDGATGTAGRQMFSHEWNPGASVKLTGFFAQQRARLCRCPDCGGPAMALTARQAQNLDHLIIPSPANDPIWRMFHARS